MRSPKIDGRNVEDIIKKIKEMAPFYTPEWKFNQENEDPGTALAHIFAAVLDGTIKRLNQVPDKNFIAFLNMLGVKLLPAQPARVPVTFRLKNNVKSPVLIPAGTKMEANPEEGAGPVVFETEKNMLSTPAKLKAVLAAIPEDDWINDYSVILDEEKRAKIKDFKKTDVQEHILYISHNELFKLEGKTKIILRIYTNTENVKYFEQALFSWEYYDGKGWVPSLTAAEGALKTDKIFIPVQDDITLDVTKVESNQQKGCIEITLAKKFENAVEIKDVNGVESYFLRCRLAGKDNINETGLTNLSFTKLALIILPLANGEFQPDALFRHDLEIKLPPANAMNVFGGDAGGYDILYIASKRALSNKKATVTITLTYDSGSKTTGTDLVLSWEYWNGKGWNALWVIPGQVKDSKQSFEFICPEDSGLFQVNGKENHWLRVRPSFYNTDKKDYVKIKNIAISYIPKEILPDKLLSYNNLSYEELINGSDNIPFKSISGEGFNLYLGFDKPPLKGMISAFFSLGDRMFDDDTVPRLGWHYSSSTSGGWGRLITVDGTNNMTRSGTVEFSGPSDFAENKLFGSSLYWIRANSVLDKPETVMLPRIRPRSAGGSLLWQSGRKYSDLLPDLKGIFLNTTWAMQSERIEGELPEKTGDDPAYEYKLSRYPVFSESVWINEMDTLTEYDRKTLSDLGEYETRVVSGKDGAVNEFWVRWKAVEDLTDLSPGQRCYEIDRAFGHIRFGNGIHGMLLPSGSYRIKVDYSTGGGLKGNVKASEVSSLKSTLIPVESINNPVPAEGGFDVESIKQAMERGPRTIRHRNRAVTTEDFEWLAYQASRSIAKAKCLPNVKDLKQDKTGCVTLVIVPSSSEIKPIPSTRLKLEVEEYLRKRAANAVSFAGSLRVTGPEYIEISIKATLVVESLDILPLVEKEAYERLNSFIHPLYGGYYGKGWEFGRYPHLSDFYALLEGINGVDYVENLVMIIAGAGSTPLEVTDASTFYGYFKPYNLICSGKHLIETSGKS